MGVLRGEDSFIGGQVTVGIVAAIRACPNLRQEIEVERQLGGQRNGGPLPGGGGGQTADIPKISNSNVKKSRGEC